MKKVEAIISAFRLDDVKEALVGAGIEAMTVSEVMAYDGHSGPVTLFRGGRYTVDFHPRVRVELALVDEQLSTAVAALERAGQSREDSEESIVVIPIAEVVKIRTGERGPTAIRTAVSDPVDASHAAVAARL